MTFDERCHEAAAIFERGQHDEALAIFEELASDESADNFARAMMCLNIATVAAKQGSKIRVMKAYERAAGLALYAYLIIQEKRIAWLLENANFQNALEVIEKVLQIDDLSAEDRATYQRKQREVQNKCG